MSYKNDSLYYDFYKIVCKTDKLIEYIGSSIDFNKRKDCHYLDIDKERTKNLKIYKMIRENGGFNNFDFILLGSIKCVDLKEALIIEQHLINKYKPIMNTTNASRYTFNDLCNDNVKDFIINELTEQEQFNILDKIIVEKLNQNISYEDKQKYNKPILKLKQKQRRQEKKMIEKRMNTRIKYPSNWNL